MLTIIPQESKHQEEYTPRFVLQQKEQRKQNMQHPISRTQLSQPPVQNSQTRSQIQTQCRERYVTDLTESNDYI